MRRKRTKPQELVNKRFGRLLILEILPLPTNKYGRTEFRCKCDCGKEPVFQITYLMTGDTRSCGCLALEIRTKHGHAKNGKRDLTYTSWESMISRCFNPNRSCYSYYGGRGITVCDSWRNSFKTFFNDMGPRPIDRTLDRIDVNGNYEPNNCRWATKKEQANNTRRQIKTTLTS